MRASHLFALVTSALALLLASTIVTAQETQSPSFFTTAHSLDLERISDPQISPDARQIIYTRRWVNQMEDKWETALWIMDADGSHNRFLSKGSSPRWSPDGARVAYLADGEPKGTQLFVRWIGVDGPATQVTTLHESPADVKWSPDGKWIGFSMFVPKEAVWKIDMPTAPTGAKWTGSPRIVQRGLSSRQSRSVLRWCCPNGSTVSRLPGYHRWTWDGEFCGSIDFRCQPGTTELSSRGDS